MAVERNRNFLELYEPYIRHDWKQHYFAYDGLKEEYKNQKATAYPNPVLLDQRVHSDVKRVDFFLAAVLNDIERELVLLEKEESCDHSIELVVRQLYEKCMDCEKFFELNLFAMLKTIKKVNKLPVSDNAGTFVSLAQEFVESTFRLRIVTAATLKSRCIELYTGKFCRNYPSLGNGELKFVKNKERVGPQTPFVLAFKFGVSAAVVLLITADAYLGQDNKTSHNWFWTNPALYVYTTVGNMLVFRITWATNLIMWNRFGVNYIPIFQFPDNKPNMMIVFDHISTQLLLFSLNLLLYYEANKSTSVLANVEFFRSSFPVVLVLLYFLYEVWEYYLHGNTYRLSRGVFSMQALYNCSITPFAKVTFRDNYVANTLTSFTKVFADFFHAACWIVCGAFLRSSSSQTVDSFGAGSNFSCTGNTMVLVIIVSQLIPQWMRFGQNLRQYVDTGLARYPWNMLKYSLTMLVILYGHFHDEYEVGSIVLVAIVALYKWWWDVVMNWGLFDCETFRLDSLWLVKSGGATGMVESTQPSSVFGLRKQLMFPYASLYYICIVGNLVLRFLWVMSLLPPSVTRSFVGPKFSFFLASMELVRRAMWGLLKTEYEHIRYALARKPGYYFRRSLVDSAAPNASSGGQSPKERKDQLPVDEESLLEDSEAPHIVRLKPSTDILVHNGSFAKIAASQGNESSSAEKYEIMMVNYDSDDDSDGAGPVGIIDDTNASVDVENQKDK